MIRISASAIPRLLACPGSGHLPHADYRTAYADAGHERHAEQESAADLGDHDGLDPRVQALLEPGDQLATECSFAYDASDDTARALGHLARRDYQELRPFEIPGTIDLLVVGARRILVVDYKGIEEVDPAAENAQTLTYALMVARATGRDEIVVAIIYLAAPWRAADVATITAFDLDGHAARLRSLVTSTDRMLWTGKHCKYCPAFLACPEQKQLGDDAGGGALAVRVESMIPFASDDDARMAYELRGKVRVFLQRLEAALFARAAERPIPLGNGKMFGRHTKLGNEQLDGDTTYEVVREMHGQAVADAAVIRSATKTRIKEALKRAGIKVAPAEREVLAAVRARGGATRKETTEI
ncbi:MAG TPA: PD-(D/E)XK nuclease family protein, partial [Kofleriaceae bacterium]|nr:PD-(D/E)XK nuclease family protein [Kofleriaceae bacterium]